MRQLFFILLVGIITINSIMLTQQIIGHQGQATGFLGDQFIGLEKIFQNTKTVGYYTDLNLDAPSSARQLAVFQQAQLTLAPILLDLNNTKTAFVIFNCSSPLICLEKINTLGLKPITRNNQGIIIAMNPQATGINL